MSEPRTIYSDCPRCNGSGQWPSPKQGKPIEMCQFCDGTGAIADQITFKPDPKEEDDVSKLDASGD